MLTIITVLPASEKIHMKYLHTESIKRLLFPPLPTPQNQLPLFVSTVYQRNPKAGDRKIKQNKKPRQQAQQENNTHSSEGHNYSVKKLKRKRWFKGNTLVSPSSFHSSQTTWQERTTCTCERDYLHVTVLITLLSASWPARRTVRNKEENTGHQVPAFNPMLQGRKCMWNNWELLKHFHHLKLMWHNVS